MRGTNKPTVYASREAVSIVEGVSKQALLDAAWNLALLGTDETPEQVLAHLCHELVITLDGRGDRVPARVRELARGKWEGNLP